LAEWRSLRTSPDGRWVEIISHFNTNDVPYSKVLKLVWFFLSLPGTNTPTEQVFFFMNSLWTGEKTQLFGEILKAVLITRVNLSTLASIFSKCCVIKDTS
jgi:hypothetical protein